MVNQITMKGPQLFSAWGKNIPTNNSARETRAPGKRPAIRFSDKPNMDVIAAAARTAPSTRITGLTSTAAVVDCFDARLSRSARVGAHRRIYLRKFRYARRLAPHASRGTCDGAAENNI